MTIETMTRKWGNSLGITIPKEVVDEAGLEENQRVLVEIRKSADLKSIRGLVHLKKPTQQIKDEMRKGWK